MTEGKFQTEENFAVAVMAVADVIRNHGDPTGFLTDWRIDRKFREAVRERLGDYR